MSTQEENRTIIKMIQETNAVGGYCGFYIKYKRKEKLKYQQSVGIVLREVLLELERGARQNEV